MMMILKKGWRAAVAMRELKNLVVVMSKMNFCTKVFIGEIAGNGTPTH